MTKNQRIKELEDKFHSFKEISMKLFKTMDEKLSSLKTDVRNLSEGLDDIKSANYTLITNNYVGKYFKIERKSIEMRIINVETMEYIFIKVQTPHLIRQVCAETAIRKVKKIEDEAIETWLYVDDSNTFDISELTTEITKEEYESVLKEAVKQKYNID